MGLASMIAAEQLDGVRAEKSNADGHGDVTSHSLCVAGSWALHDGIREGGVSRACARPSGEPKAHNKRIDRKTYHDAFGARTQN